MTAPRVTSPHFVRNKILKHKTAYIESVGKLDLDNLAAIADAPEGKGTVLRLIMGATDKMPFRALGYVDSILRLAQVIPAEQIQLVHANHLGSFVNGLDINKARQQATLLATVACFLVATNHPDLTAKVLHAEDTPIDLMPFMTVAKTALSAHPEIDSALGQKGAKHRGDHVSYTAAHCAYQDTDRLVLSSPLSQLSSPKQIAAERIVSVGCQQERPFYLARMAMRGFAEDIELVKTAQVFTKHVSPPYYVASGGEVTLEDALRGGFHLDQVGDVAAMRDLRHLVSVLSEGEI